MIDWKCTSSITEIQVKELRRLFITLFKSNRVSEVFRELNINNLKQTFKIEPELFTQFEHFVRSELAAESEKIDLVNLKANPFGGSSNGPNGLPKIESAPMEAYALTMGKDDLYRYMKEYCHITGNDSFISYLESVAKHFEDKNPEASDNFNNILLRKLSAIADVGNKSRTIAISDYWTQSLLQPLEIAVNKVTNTIFGKECCFYSHARG